ncbi:MAG: transporter (plasmid) [Candidatus Manganitrophus sp.]|nr:transporter [Candidatus Manganitrophus sp.]MDC4228242.1 transporter [Candidatus Manganitrophus sp.]WDT73501.1 MAG: transporter [Candidatus Manganitrophus sp.]
MRRIVLWNVTLLVGLLAMLTSKVAFASCGSANCFLVTGTQEGIAIPGQIIIDLSYRFIPMDQPQKGRNKVSEAFTPGVNFSTGEIEPAHHREVRTNNELAQMDVSFGATERLSLTLAVPFLNLRTHEHAVFHEGEPGEFSRQDGTSGFGDLRLTGRYALWVSTRHLIVGGVGVKAPTGEYKLLNHDGEINEPTIQPGTGSWDGIASLYYAFQVVPHEFDVFLSGSYQANTENPLDYRIGDIFILNVGGSYRLMEKALVSLQINGRQAPHDEFKGEKVPSTGGRWVYLTPGVTLQASPNTALYTHVQLPVYQEVNEENIVPRYGLIFGVSHTF